MGACTSQPTGKAAAAAAAASPEPPTPPRTPTPPPITLPVADGFVSMDHRNAAVAATSPSPSASPSPMPFLFEELATLRDEQLVNATAWSPDGTLLAIGGWDHLIKLYSASNLDDLLRTLDTGADVWSLAFSPDGATLASSHGYPTHAVCLWNPNTGALLQTLMGHSANVWELCFAPNYRFLASVSNDSTCRIWDTKTGATCLTLSSSHTSFIYSLHFSANGRYLATGGADNTAVVHEVTPALLALGAGSAAGEAAAHPSVARTFTLGKHTERVTCVRFTPDCRRVVTASFDTHIRVWQLQADSCVIIKTLEHRRNPVRSLCFVRDPGGTLFMLSGSYSGSVLVWNLDRLRNVGILETVHDDSVRCLAVSRDQRRLATCSYDKTSKVFDLRNANQTPLPPAPRDRGVAIDAMSALLAIERAHTTVRSNMERLAAVQASLVDDPSRSHRVFEDHVVQSLTAACSLAAVSRHLDNVPTLDDAHANHTNHHHRPTELKERLAATFQQVQHSLATREPIPVSVLEEHNRLCSEYATALKQALSTRSSRADALTSWLAETDHLLLNVSLPEDPPSPTDAADAVVSTEEAENLWRLAEPLLDQLTQSVAQTTACLTQLEGALQQQMLLMELLRGRTGLHDDVLRHRLALTGRDLTRKLDSTASALRRHIERATTSEVLHQMRELAFVSQLHADAESVGRARARLEQLAAQLDEAEGKRTETEYAVLRAEPTHRSRHSRLPSLVHDAKQVSPLQEQIRRCAALRRQRERVELFLLRLSRDERIPEAMVWDAGYELPRPACCEVSEDIERLGFFVDRALRLDYEVHAEQSLESPRYELLVATFDSRAVVLRTMPARALSRTLNEPLVKLLSPWGALHPGLFGFEALVEAADTRQVFLQYPYREAGNLRSWLESVAPVSLLRTFRLLVRGVLETLAFLHDRDLAHGRLHAANVLMTGVEEDARPQLMDFECAHQAETDMAAFAALVKEMLHTHAPFQQLSEQHATVSTFLEDLEDEQVLEASARHLLQEAGLFHDLSTEVGGRSVDVVECGGDVLDVDPGWDFWNWQAEEVVEEVAEEGGDDVAEEDGDDDEAKDESDVEEHTSVLLPLLKPLRLTSQSESHARVSSFLAIPVRPDSREHGHVGVVFGERGSALHTVHEVLRVESADQLSRYLAVRDTSKKRLVEEDLFLPVKDPSHLALILQLGPLAAVEMTGGNRPDRVGDDYFYSSAAARARGYAPPAVLGEQVLRLVVMVRALLEVREEDEDDAGPARLVSWKEDARHVPGLVQAYPAYVIGFE